jgi:hypothetical protein
MTESARAKAKASTLASNEARMKIARENLAAKKK